ncbi:MAG: ABC transporter permease subunit [Polaromonas sp.]|uniref:ABC transporter permease subunit n=1 Tax=Polaromonas sp. TaxID=1869339 RepID=UPI002736EFC9|nr:ABC transporter permease subunit [Polaromonas sp.]MDP2817700.1 ABC transporter permease subunit [Polaromonas sp.]
MQTSQTQTARLAMVMRQELRLLLAERSLWIVATLFLLLIGYALYNGVLQTRLRDQAQAAIVASDAQTRASQLALLGSILQGSVKPAPFQNPADPANMGGGYGAQHAILPSGPLAPIALGQTDLFPGQFKVTFQSRIHFIHNNDIENPWHLLSGHFDLAFVIVYLLPLLIFALSYNLLSGERESGTLRLLVSQPLLLRTLVLGKVAVRAAVLLGMAALVPVAVLLLARPEALGAAGATFWWALLVAAYALFWFALVVAVNAFGKSSATNAMVLVIGWVMLVLIVPVLLNLGVTAASPAPSRTELATRTRMVTIEAMNRYQKLLAADYRYMDKPEVLLPKDGKIELSGRQLANFSIQRQTDDEIQPELDRFDAQQARQQQLVARYSAVSPAAVAYEAMTALAGTGGRRHTLFMDQMAQYHRDWKAFFFPRIDGGVAMSEADFARIPKFAWKEEPADLVRKQALQSLLQLILPSLLLLGVAGWRLRRYAVV